MTRRIVLTALGDSAATPPEGITAPVVVLHSFAAIDARHDFDPHHTPADTRDKVEPDAMRRQVALPAAVAWFLAERSAPIGIPAPTAPTPR